ncbi:MAG: PIN domain-containing protein [Nanoarchaeota archaeon]
MYLDTDIVLALIKKEDWLKEHVHKLNLKDAKTSALTVIEARIVLDREYSEEDAKNALSKIKAMKIEILSVDEEVIEKSQKLIEEYSDIGMFDAVHVACAIIHNEIIISTDNFFKQIKEITVKDPRDMDNLLD